MATLISAQCCDLGLGDFDPDASPASIPNGEPSIGYVAMKSANDAQQDLILADGELRNHDSSLILRKYVNCPACTVLELQQGTHLGQNKPDVVETRSLSSVERAHGEALAYIVVQHGMPEHLRSDNGSEFVAKELGKAYRCRIRTEVSLLASLR
jgi:hypothetical protein